MKRVIVGICLLNLFLYISCKNNNNDKNDYGDWLKIGVTYSMDNLNPIGYLSMASGFLNDVVYDGLVEVNKNGKIIPKLAYKWEWLNDGKGLIFYLRDDVIFHDGDKFDSKDVFDTFNLLLNPQYMGVFKDELESVSNIKILNDYTIEFKFKNKSISFMYDLFIPILSNEYLISIKNNLNNISNCQIGTGPFKVKSIENNQIVLEANNIYYLGRPYLNGIIFQSFNNENEILIEMLNEKIDFSFMLESELFNFSKNNKNIKIYKYLLPYYFMIMLNNKHKYFKSIRVRKALNYAIDREEIIRKLLKGNGMQCNGIILPNTWSYNKDIDHFTYNPSLAKKLLNEDGWKYKNKNIYLQKNNDIFQFDLIVFKESNLSKQIGLLIEDCLSNVGIKVNINVISINKMINILTSKNYEAIINFIFSGNHPDYGYRFWNSSKIENGLNFSSYYNPKIDEYFKNARYSTSRSNSKLYYYKIQEEMYNDPPGIFLFWKEEQLVVHKRFKDINKMNKHIFLEIPNWWVPKEEQKYKEPPV